MKSLAPSLFLNPINQHLVQLIVSLRNGSSSEQNPFGRTVPLPPGFFRVLHKLSILVPTTIGHPSRNLLLDIGITPLLGPQLLSLYHIGQEDKRPALFFQIATFLLGAGYMTRCLGHSCFTPKMMPFATLQLGADPAFLCCSTPPFL